MKKTTKKSNKQSIRVRRTATESEEIVGNLFDSARFRDDMKRRGKQMLFDHFMLAAIEAGHSPTNAAQTALSALQVREETKAKLHAMEFDPTDAEMPAKAPATETKKVTSCAECTNRVCHHGPCPHGLSGKT